MISRAVPTAQSHACKPTAIDTRKRRARATQTCVSCRRIEMSFAMGSRCPSEVDRIAAIKLILR